MHIGFYNYHKEDNNNKMFTDPSSSIGDNLNYPFVLLSQRLKAMGHRLSIIDTNSIEEFDAVVFIEFPGINNKYFKRFIKSGFKNLYLILLESPIIKPDNYITENHKHFKKVFTWSDELVDNPSINSGAGRDNFSQSENSRPQAKKYFKLNLSHKIPKILNFDIRKREKLCAIISSNKSMGHPKELYTERIKAIRWFEQNHPENFDLFGMGWDRYNFEGKVFRINIARLNRLKFLTKLLAPHYPSYKGSIRSKNETYQKYKFAVCYENTQAPGYITEKIFDCFLAGCVPIYWGAQNITNHIPQNTFIDKKKFKTYDELYAYIKNMPEIEYKNYLYAIKKFLEGKDSYPFGAECFAETLIKEIVTAI